MAHLLEVIYYDLCTKKNKKIKDFQLKSYYKTLREGGTTFPCKALESLCTANSRVAFFLWCMVVGKILITNNLSKVNYYGLVNLCVKTIKIM